jgi:hypothetical protein
MSCGFKLPNFAFASTLFIPTLRDANSAVETYIGWIVVLQLIKTPVNALIKNNFLNMLIDLNLPTLLQAFRFAPFHG